MPPALGRNDPCPCGSGRKYKHCCLRANDTTDFVWRQLRAAEGRLVPELFKLAIAEYGGPFIGAALDEFFVWDGVPENYEETDEFGSFFVPWFVFAFVADPHDADRPADAPEEPIAAVYLRRHAGQLSTFERAFLEAAQTSPLSFYAITKTTPGRDMSLHDVLTGTDVVVRESSASQTARPGGLLFTRVITIDQVSIMSGCAPLLIPPSWHNIVIDLRTRFAPRGRQLIHADLMEFDIELRDLYFDIEDTLHNPRLPEVRNTDGDPLVLTTLKFRIQCSPLSAFERLETLAREHDTTLLLSEAGFDEAGTLRSVSIPWIKKGNRLHKDWTNTTLGTLEIAGDRLDVHVNSKRRAQRARREIEKRLGSDAVLEDTTAEGIASLIEQRRTQPIDPIAEAAQDRLEQQPGVREFMQRTADAHWKAWLDEKIPALGNRSPRQAARTAAGRERLEALLAHYAWESERSPQGFAPDVAALRAKLRLPEA